MKRYKVQWAFGGGVGQPNIYSQEEPARSEVAYLIGNWIPRHLEQHAELVGAGLLRRGSDEFEESVRYMAQELPRLVAENKVWEAYGLWEDFYARFENEPGYPLFLVLGTVIVEGSPQTKLRNRFPLMEIPDEPPIETYRRKGHKFIVMNPLLMLRDRVVAETEEVAARKADLKGIELTSEQFDKAVQEALDEIGDKYGYMRREDEAKFAAELREGILKRLFPRTSIGLGAFRSWLVQYADIGGAWHPGRHTNEARAKLQAQEYLERLLFSLSRHIGMQQHARGRTEYVRATQRMIHHVKRLIENGWVWAAYLAFKEFQEEWSDTGGAFPLEMAVGTMRVVPEPEPESGSQCQGSAC